MTKKKKEAAPRKAKAKSALPMLTGHEVTAMRRKEEIREVLRKIREDDVHDAIAEVRNMLKFSTDSRVKIWAIEFIFKYGVGTPVRIPVTPVEEVQVEKAELQKQIEQLLARFALDGDVAAMNAALAGLDPAKYGKKKDEEKKDDDEPRTVLNFVRMNESTNPSIDEEEDQSDDDEA